MDTPVPQSSLSGSPPPTPGEAVTMRAVHRAIIALRRGAPVLLHGETAWLLLAAETAGGSALALMAEWQAAPPLLLLGEGRAQGLMQQSTDTGSGLKARARALGLPPELITPAGLRRLADPTLDQNFGDLRFEEQPRAAAAGDTEAAIGLAKIARLLPAVLAARIAPQDCDRIAGRGVARVLSAAVEAYPTSVATHVMRVAEASVPLDFAPHARIVAFRAPEAGIEHLAILVGEPETEAPELPPPLARIHSECFTGDLIGSLRCDCGTQLRGAIRRMGDEGRGVLLYLAQEGRGIGLVNKLRAYTLQDRGLDTFDANHALGWGADERNFLVAATMLRELRIPRVRLLTNNPDKLAALAACGIEVTARESHSFAPNGINDDYLASKASRFGHLFDS